MTAPRLSSDELARERTMMALERTQMAWVRTGLSMLTFGFSLLKFFEFVREEHPVHPSASRDLEPRSLGLAIMVLGLLTLSGATVQYVSERKRLGAPPARKSGAFLMSVVLILVQAAALIWSLIAP